MCLSCNNNLPNIYHYSGPHIKEVCSNCGTYIKFAPKISIPTIEESREWIWEITHDLAVINKYKSEMPNTTNIDWHNLKVQIMKHYC